MTAQTEKFYVELEWTGSFQIKELLARCLEEGQAWPPAADGVYVVSQKVWEGSPTLDCGPLYVGGNTGRSKRFCTRVGDLIADMHGFWDGGTGHHSGGQKLWKWCKKNDNPPGGLFLGWATAKEWCGRCAEVQVASALHDPAKPWADNNLLNKNRPPQCPDHSKYVP